jgi:hypothetical protein
MVQIRERGIKQERQDKSKAIVFLLILFILSIL